MNDLLSLRRLIAGGALIAGSLALGACGGGSDATPSADQGHSAAADAGDGDLPYDLPAACKDAFPIGVGKPDLSSVTLLPSDWPEAPAGATLCRTSATADGSMQSAEYATDTAGAEVLAAYKKALPPSYEATTERKALGDALVGSSDSVTFEVQPRDGAFSIAFGPR